MLIGESSAASLPACAALTRGQRQAAAERGWQLVTLDAQLSPERQRRDLERLLALEVDAITTWTLDPRAVEQVYARARAANVPLVGFNSASPAFGAVVAQASDTAEGPGADAADLIAARRERARTLVLSGPPVAAMQRRGDCFLAAAEQRRLEVVGSAANVEDSTDAAVALTSALLAEHGDVDAIWCFNDLTALGAARALEEAGRAVWSGGRDGVVVIGINGSETAVEAVREGRLSATYDCRPVEAGRAGIEAVEHLLRHPGSPLREITIPFARCDAANVDDYVPWSER